MQLLHRRHVHEEGSCGPEEVVGQIPGLEAGITETTAGLADGAGSVFLLSIHVLLLSLLPPAAIVIPGSLIVTSCTAVSC